MDASQLPPAPQSIKTLSVPERSHRKQLTDNRSSDASRMDRGIWDMPSLGTLRRSAGTSTYPSDSDQIFHGPEAQPTAFALCDVMIIGRQPAVDRVQRAPTPDASRHPMPR